MERRTATPDAVIADLAGRQHRLVSRRQLLAAGIGSEAIRHRLEVRRLHRHHPGVYSVGTYELDRPGRWLAAVLACGRGAVLSHRSAAALWRLRSERPGPVHVTVPGSRSSKRTGIVVHATRSLPGAETRRVNRVPVTSVERTLIDLAGDPEIDRLVEQAYALKLIGRTRIKEALARANGKRGTRQLRLLFARLSEDLPLTRSELERRFLRLVERAGLPKPCVNRHHATHRVDFAWPEHRPGRRDRRPRHPRQPLRLPPGSRPRSRPRARRTSTSSGSPGGR